MFKTFSTYAIALTAAFVLSAQVNTADAAKEKFERTKPHTTVTQDSNKTADTDNCEDGSEETARSADREEASNECDPDEGTTAGSGSGTKYSGNKEAGY